MPIGTLFRAAGSEVTSAKAHAITIRLRELVRDADNDTTRKFHPLMLSKAPVKLLGTEPVHVFARKIQDWVPKVRRASTG